MESKETDVRDETVPRPMQVYAAVFLWGLLLVFWVLMSFGCADLISGSGGGQPEQDSPGGQPAAPPPAKHKPKTKSKTRTAQARLKHNKATAAASSSSRVSLKMTPAAGKTAKKAAKSRNLRTKTKPPSSKTAPTGKGKAAAASANNNRSPFGKVKSSKPATAKKQQHPPQANLVHKTGDSALKVSHSSSFGSYARVEPRKTEEYCSEMSSSIPDPDED